MAAKKKAGRRPGGKHVDIHKLSRDVAKEARGLLRRHQLGNVTGRELKIGLRELDRDLKQLYIWIHIICPK